MKFRAVRRRGGYSVCVSLLVVLVSAVAPAGAESQATARYAGATATQANTLTLPGQVLAYRAVLVTAKVAGFLRRITVDKGDQVRAGQVIAELEVPELLADQIRDRARVDVAHRVFDRMRSAAKSAPDLVTPDDLDQARGQLEVAQGELDRVQALLGYARVTAPFAGTITARYVDPGAYIPVASQTSQQSAALASLMDFSRVRVQVWIPEVEAPRIRPGCRAVFTALALPGRRFTAAVTRVSYALQGNAHTMLAEIELANPGHLLQPGMYLSVRLAPQADPAQQP